MTYNNVSGELTYVDEEKWVYDISIDAINLKANANIKIYGKCSEGSAGFNYGAKYCISLNDNVTIFNNGSGKITTTKWTLIWEETIPVNYNADGTLDLNMKIGYLNYLEKPFFRAETTVTLPVISNSHFKKNGKWLSSYSWIKRNNVWKHCLIWKKINGVWRRGV